MPRPAFSALSVLALGLGLALPAAAQTLLTGNHSINGRLCVGDFCTASESFNASDVMKLEQTATGIYFNDTSTSTFPNRDWRFVVGDTFDGGAEYFALQDVTAARQVLRIEGNAPWGALFLDAAGELGLGTTLPEREIHMKGGDAVSIRLEQDGSLGDTPQIWDIVGDEVGYSIVDQTGAREVMRIAAGTRSNALFIDDDGQVGLGTGFPVAPLHLPRDDGTAKLLIEETNALQSPRTLLQIANNGRPEIVMANTGTGGEWSFGAGTNFVLKQGAVGSSSAAKAKLFEVKANGDAIVQGTLTTSGTICRGGCDAVFTENRVIPAAEYHAQMWAQGHLPHVGPTVENQPVNITEKLGGMLNALEHAHIYIERQDREIAALRAELARLAAALDE